MRTPITYYGGKQNLSERIVSMMPRHKIYCEPFFGGGAVFFAKPKAGIEVINDKNDLLINFSRSASPHPNLRSYVRESGYRYTPSLTTLGLGTFIEDDLRSRM